MGRRPRRSQLQSADDDSIPGLVEDDPEYDYEQDDFNFRADRERRLFGR